MIKSCAVTINRTEKEKKKMKLLTDVKELRKYIKDSVQSFIINDIKVDIERSLVDLKNQKYLIKKKSNIAKNNSDSFT